MVRHPLPTHTIITKASSYQGISQYYWHDHYLSYTTQNDCQCLAAEQKLRSLEQGVHRLKQAQNKTKVLKFMTRLWDSHNTDCCVLAVGESGGAGDVCQEQSKGRVCVTWPGWWRQSTSSKQEDKTQTKESKSECSRAISTHYFCCASIV